MNKKTEPLMFINTVSTPAIDDYSQEKFDSRYPKKEFMKDKDTLIKEIDNYLKNTELTSYLVVSNISYEGIIYERNGDVLTINNNGQILKIDINMIKDIKPIKI